MDAIFSKQTEHKLEVYIDDMRVKTYEGESHTTDLKDITRSVMDYNMFLNLTKCSFGMQTDQLLVFMLTKRGINVNPNKYQVIIYMRSPSNVK